MCTVQNLGLFGLHQLRPVVLFLQLLLQKRSALLQLLYPLLLLRDAVQQPPVNLLSIQILADDRLYV